MLSYPERAAQVMEHMCSHPAHGYSQPNRPGIGTGGTVGETIILSDGTKVGISGGDRDCSSACIECYAALGVDVGGATYTGNMRQCMTSTGNFRWHPWGTYTAKRGDIYLNETHHTAMCLGNGKLGEFSRSELHSTHGAKGDQDGWESHVARFYTYSKGGWDGVLEYVGPEPETEDELTDADIERIAQLAADKVVNYELNGTLLRDRIIGTDIAANAAAREATRTDDCTGRGMENNDHDHIKWLAAGQAKQNETLAAIVDALGKVTDKLDAVAQTLDGFVPAVETDEGATD